jgi:hypothetical protein
MLSMQELIVKVLFIGLTMTLTALAGLKQSMDLTLQK